MQISKGLKFYRKKKKLTQLKVASEIHISRQMISQWENDTVLPDLNMLEN